MPATTKNISSDEIEQTEVDKIAAELRHELDDSKKSTQPQPNKTHNVELKPGKDDTIFIDQDGSFHINEQTK